MKTTSFHSPSLTYNEFQHFILRFNKISLLNKIQLTSLKEGIGGEREGDFMDYFNILCLTPVE
jgi:hypothetical protein